ncbi:nuclear transport factor 2 family protein [Sphingosinicella sp. BN140058]|uniref:nuclear transport factor 2 family protein n=1 Tax=Sphingosinicella sp. BN140058 TaxID=1892855 RepID=UPI001010692D|nr:nuclear transport factor 2 family protein [Sphingosinicella sp. BN140058]QAY76231.1 nuclear transport factor 2 family protein [Sphingosinicella sp. BN140058]
MKSRTRPARSRWPASRRLMLVCALGASSGLAASTHAAPPAEAADRPGIEAEIGLLIRSFIAAQRGRDVATLERLTTPDYLEVSPIGDVDDRTAMQGFYAPENAKSAPRIDVADLVVREFGTAAVGVARLDYVLPPPRSAGAMRATYVAKRSHGTWLLASVQYTPVRAGGAEARQ